MLVLSYTFPEINKIKISYEIYTIVIRKIVPRNWSKLMKLMVTTLSLNRTILLSKIMGKRDANLKITISFLPLIALWLSQETKLEYRSSTLKWV